MPRFSTLTDPKKLSTFIHRFWDAITLIEDRNEAVNFLKELLTPTEVRMLAKRLQIADMLAKGYKYEDIRNYVRATAQTIAAVNNKLSVGEGGMIKILQKLEKIDKARQAKLEKRFNPLSHPPNLGRAAINLGSVAITKAVRHHKKVDSVISSKN